MSMSISTGPTRNPGPGRLGRDWQADRYLIIIRRNLRILLCIRPEYRTYIGVVSVWRVPAELHASFGSLSCLSAPILSGLVWPRPFCKRGSYARRSELAYYIN